MREAVGGSVTVTAKLNMSDGTHKGFDINQSIEFARMLEADGYLDALQLVDESDVGEWNIRTPPGRM